MEKVSYSENIIPTCGIWTDIGFWHCHLGIWPVKLKILGKTEDAASPSVEPKCCIRQMGLRKGDHCHFCLWFKTRMWLWFCSEDTWLCSGEESCYGMSHCHQRRISMFMIRASLESLHSGLFLPWSIPGLQVEFSSILGNGSWKFPLLSMWTVNTFWPYMIEARGRTIKILHSFCTNIILYFVLKISAMCTYW